MLGPGLTNAMIALTIVFIPGFTRLIRGADARRCARRRSSRRRSRSGRNRGRILVARVLPNVASPIIVQASLALGSVLLAEATLSFLGVGVAAAAVELGRDAQRRLREDLHGTRGRWCIPGAAIVLTVLAFNLLGDGLRDAFSVDTGGASARAAPASPGSCFRATTATRPPPTTRPRPSRPARCSRSTGLTVEFVTEQGVHRVVDDVSFFVRPGEIVGLVGESGSGKTVTSLAVMRLVPSPPGRIVGGSIRFDGQRPAARRLRRRCSGSAGPRSRWCSRTRCRA